MRYVWAKHRMSFQLGDGPTLLVSRHQRLDVLDVIDNDLFVQIKNGEEVVMNVMLPQEEALLNRPQRSPLQRDTENVMHRIMNRAIKLENTDPTTAERLKLAWDALYEIVTDL